MRRIFAAIILLCIFYFLGGWFAVHFGWIASDTYFAYAGIVGGLASVVGLLSFTRPALSNADLQSLELGSLKSIAETSEQIQELKKRRAETEGELETLALQKQEMQILVRKASLALFLREQYRNHDKRIAEYIEDNLELKESIKEIQKISQKLDSLNEEIKADPNVKILEEIMSAASAREPSFKDTIKDLPPILRFSVVLVQELSRAFETVFRTLLR